jgi:hypothetical protein
MTDQSSKYLNNIELAIDLIEDFTEARVDSIDRCSHNVLVDRQEVFIAAWAQCK